MRDKLMLLLGALFLFSCSEESVPEGLYDYQVERLLSGAETKLWIESRGIFQCTDSVFLRISLVEGATDSLDVAGISYHSDCSSDTLEIGRCKPSSFSSGQLFTDSLLFSNGEFWLIDRATSESLEIVRDGTAQRYMEFER